MNLIQINCAVDKHTKISVEILMSADNQKVKYRPIYRSISKSKPGLPTIRSGSS